ncbi:MAG: hypothetical protein ACI86H_003051 [bacterium]|jgi:hypothetical protein
MIDLLWVCSVMLTTLTIQIDDEIVKQAESFAKNAGKTLPQLVADYLVLLGENHTGDNQPLRPITQSLKGVFEKNDTHD